MEQIYGYARVSTREQNEARQVAARCRAAGYAGISVRRDAAGLPRCVYAEKP